MTTASTAAIATPTTATTPTPASTEGLAGAEAGGAFTTLLAAALGEATPEAVAEVLDGLQRVAGSEATAEAGEGEGEGQDAAATGKELSPRALAEAIAAITGNTPLLRGLRGPSDAAGAETAPEADQPPAAAAAAAEEGAVPVPARAEGTDAAAAATTVRPAEGRVAGNLPSAAPAPVEVEGKAARILHAVRTRTAPAATATATTTPRPEAEASPAGSSSGEPAAVAPSAVSTASPATVAGPAPARAPDAATHARLVSLVIEAAEALENAPPPRRMVVEVPGSDGLRLQVALRGTEVHVNVQSGTGGPDLGAWGRELASSLASRGMTLGGFQTGTDGQPGQRHGASRPDHPAPPDDQPTHARYDGRTVGDDDLRL